MILNRKARIFTWTAGLAAASMLSACAGNPGTALSVGDTVYSNADITAGVTQMSEMAGYPVGAPTLINTMSRAALITELAKRNDITVADSEIAGFVKEQVEQGAYAAVPSGEMSAVTRDFLRLQVINKKIATAITDPAQIEALNAQYADLVQNTPVEVSPRYGTFDAERNLVPLTLGDVVSSYAYGAH